MKAVILAGGQGTRLSDDSERCPKPMTEIGGKPILWHIMKIFSHYGINDFIVCCGFKSHLIKEWFHHYYIHCSDMTISLRDNSVYYPETSTEPWRITLADTGIHSGTGYRLRKIAKYLGHEDFMLTYGDGLVGNLDINALINFHEEHQKLVTITSVQVPGRWGSLILEDDCNKVCGFREKQSCWINGGFFVLNPNALHYIPDNEDEMWEHAALEGLVKDEQLSAFRHDGFWMAMDTPSDKRVLESLWSSGKAPWKVW